MGPVLSLPQIEALGMIGAVTLATTTSWLALRQWRRVNRLEEIVGYLLQERASPPPSLASSDTATETDWSDVTDPVYEPLAFQLGPSGAASPSRMDVPKPVDHAAGGILRALSTFHLDASADAPAARPAERQEASLRRWMANIKARGADA